MQTLTVRWYLSTNRDCIKEIQISKAECQHFDDPLSHRFNGYFFLFECNFGSLGHFQCSWCNLTHFYGLTATIVWQSAAPLRFYAIILAITWRLWQVQGRYTFRLDYIDCWRWPMQMLLWPRCQLSKISAS